MKKLIGKNQVIITALAIMIAVAGYLSVTQNEADKAAELASGQEGDEQAVTYDISDENMPVTDEAADSYQLSDAGEIITDDITGDITDASDDGQVNESEQPDVQTAGTDNVGEAVLVSSTIGAEYFSQAKLSREQTRSKNKEILMELVNSTTTTKEQKEKAVNEVIAITSDSEKETASENMLEAKGYGECIVSIVDDSVDVIVNAGELKEKDIAQIEDIVKRKTGKGAEDIVITPVGVQ